VPGSALREAGLVVFSSCGHAGSSGEVLVCVVGGRGAARAGPAGPAVFPQRFYACGLAAVFARAEGACFFH